MRSPTKRIIIVLILIHLLSPVASCAPTAGDEPQRVRDIILPEGDRVSVAVWIENLDIPWSLIFLPDGRALVSERPGRIRLIKDGKLQERPYAEVSVASIGEGGLLGLALHPAFPKEPYVYAMHTYKKGDDLYNRVIRLKDAGSTAFFDRVIFDGIPGGRAHDGGRIGFGPDGMLYIAAGETTHSELAQDLKSNGGKILRITRDGGIPDDNPFKGSPVFSYGNRNPQGIAWQPKTGRLFESEHGPTGEFGRFGHDEVNMIVKGGNYGWPKMIGAPGIRPYIDPVVVWKDATPPSGMTFYKGDLLRHLKGDLFVGTLRSECLVRIQLDEQGGVKRIEKWFSGGKGNGRFGRIRDVVEGPDGVLYFLTSNRDGRGSPRRGDDKIYRIAPK